MALNVNVVKVWLGRGRVKLLVASHLIISPGLILEHCGCDLWFTVVLGYGLLSDHGFSPSSCSSSAPCAFDYAADGELTH